MKLDIHHAKIEAHGDCAPVGEHLMGMHAPTVAILGLVTGYHFNTAIAAPTELVMSVADARILSDPPPAPDLSRHHLLSESADYWYRLARDEHYSTRERLVFMENALNHTENLLRYLAELPGDERSALLRGRVR
jgi:hypothetical protein